MSRDALPQLDGQTYLADSGIETDLIFNRGFALPEFAAFTLLDDDAGRRALRDYYDDHLAVARAAGRGIVLETPTWRANRDWGAVVGYSPDALDAVNRAGVSLVAGARDAAPGVAVVVSGCIGPRDDAYRPGATMTAAEAEEYHADQVRTFASTGVELVTAMTLTHVAEAVGIALAAMEAGVPVVLSFTVETDGRLPDGTSLGDAIEAVDVATDGYPAYYMVNCAHPTHFDAALRTAVAARAPWLPRLRGVRANASRRSHEELDAAPELDAGDPVEFGEEYARLLDLLPEPAVLGGCCGTDVRHIEQVAHAIAVSGGPDRDRTQP